MIKKLFLFGALAGVVVCAATWGVIAKQHSVPLSVVGAGAETTTASQSDTGMPPEDELLRTEFAKLNARLNQADMNFHRLEKSISEQRVLVEQAVQTSATALQAVDGAQTKSMKQSTDQTVVEVNDQPQLGDNASTYELSEEERTAQATQRWQAGLSALSYAVATEAPDEAWSQDVKDRLDRAIEGYNDKLVVDNLSCGATVCEIKSHVTMNSDGYPHSGIRIDGLIHGQMGWSGPMVSSYDIATGEFTSYLLRDDASVADYMGTGAGDG